VQHVDSLERHRQALHPRRREGENLQKLIVRDLLVLGPDFHGDGRIGDALGGQQEGVDRPFHLLEAVVGRGAFCAGDLREQRLQQRVGGHEQCGAIGGPLLQHILHGQTEGLQPVFRPTADTCNYVAAPPTVITLTHDLPGARVGDVVTQSHQRLPHVVLYRHERHLRQNTSHLTHDNVIYPKISGDRISSDFSANENSTCWKNS
jgi:hypothetical protein